MRTRVLEVDGAGPPVLLLHGFTDSADCWRPVLTHLAEHGRRAIAVDLPGHGRADLLPTPVLAHLDAFVSGMIRTWGADGVVLVGNSLGSFLAMRAAGRGDLPVRAVVGLGPAGIAATRRLRAAARLASALDPYVRPLDRAPVPAPILRGVAATYYAHQFSGSGDPTLARHFAGHIRGLDDLGRLRGYLVALARETQAEPLDLPSITVPVRLIWGDRDRLSDLRGASAFLAAVPTATLHVFAGCGHCPQLEHPAEVADLISTVPTRAPVPTALAHFVGTDQAQPGRTP